MWGGCPRFCGAAALFWGRCGVSPLSAVVEDGADRRCAAQPPLHPGVRISAAPRAGGVFMGGRVWGRYGAGFGVVTGDRSGVFMGQDLGSMGE